MVAIQIKLLSVKKRHKVTFAESLLKILFLKRIDPGETNILLANYLVEFVTKMETCGQMLSRYNISHLAIIKAFCIINRLPFTTHRSIVMFDVPLSASTDRLIWKPLFSLSLKSVMSLVISTRIAV